MKSRFTRGAWREPDEALDVKARLSRGYGGACELEKKKKKHLLSLGCPHFLSLGAIMFLYFILLGL